MINILPPEEKNKLAQDKKEKLIIVLGIIISVSLVALMLILLSVKFYILADADYQKNTLVQAENISKTAESVRISNTIGKYNEILSKISSFYSKEIYFNDILSLITSIPTPTGLRITNFTLSRDSKGAVLVSISGISDTRDNLLIFKNNIEADKRIENLHFSQGSWIDQENANYSLNFSINK